MRTVRRGPPNSPANTAIGPGALAGFALWRDAMAWQRAVNRALRSLGLTHTQVLVMSALDSASKGTEGAVSQSIIAREAGLDKVTVSAVVRSLEGRGLVDRGMTDGDARAWRVILTRKGAVALGAAVRLVEEASTVLRSRQR
jgi:DNA-binding MarR family transcriptional regulator